MNRRLESFLQGFLFLPVFVSVLVTLYGIVYLVSTLVGFCAGAVCVLILMSIGLGLMQAYGPF